MSDHAAETIRRWIRNGATATMGIGDDLLTQDDVDAALGALLAELERAHTGYLREIDAISERYEDQLARLQAVKEQYEQALQRIANFSTRDYLSWTPESFALAALAAVGAEAGGEDEWKLTYEKVDFAPIWSREDLERRAASLGYVRAVDSETGPE